MVDSNLNASARRDARGRVVTRREREREGARAREVCVGREEAQASWPGTLVSRRPNLKRAASRSIFTPASNYDRPCRAKTTTHLTKTFVFSFSCTRLLASIDRTPAQRRISNCPEISVTGFF